MLVFTTIKTPSLASNYAFYFHLALNFRLCTYKNAPASRGLRSPGTLLGLRPWTPLLNRWINRSQRTMNQDNKISSVCPRTINIGLGPESLDLYGLLYHRGLRSVDDIYGLQSAHTKNNRARCALQKKTTPIASNYAFHFHRALNFRFCSFKNAPASGGLRPQTSCRGFASGPHWGTSVPQTPCHWGTSVLQTPWFSPPTSPSRSTPANDQ